MKVIENNHFYFYNREIAEKITEEARKALREMIKLADDLGLKLELPYD